MEDTGSVTKDPICGMTVDKATKITLQESKDAFFEGRKTISNHLKM